MLPGATTTKLVPFGRALPNANEKGPVPHLSGRALVVWGGGAPILEAETPPQLGFIDAVLGLVGGIFGAKSAAKQQKQQLQAQMEMNRQNIEAQLKAAELMSKSQERVAEFGLKAEKEKASYAYQTSALEADAVAGGIRAQRAAQVDALNTQLIANTQNGIFRVSAAQVEQAGETARAIPKSNMIAFALLAGVFLLAMKPPSFGRKSGSRKDGEFFRRDIRRGEQEGVQSEPVPGGAS